MKTIGMLAWAVALLVLPAFGAQPQRVTIASAPPGATVFIDDAYAGTSPVSKELAAGKHRVRLRRKGYRDWMAEIGKRNRQLVRDRFSWTHVAERVVDVLPAPPMPTRRATDERPPESGSHIWVACATGVAWRYAEGGSP